jgi:SAM-dependent methyltransferase
MTVVYTQRGIALPSWSLLAEMGVCDDISEQIRLDPSEVYELMAPYLKSRLSIHSEEWSTHHRRELKKWRRALWRRRMKQFGFGYKRDQARVRERYSSSWRNREWPSPVSLTSSVDSYDWHTEGLKAKVGGLKRVHQRLLWRCIEVLRPQSVLEVGCGNGINLLALSTGFPNVRWTGIELSLGGVARAKEAQREAELLSEIAAFCSWPNEAPEAYREIDFREGDARHLPFDSGSFDLVFTVLALEQMEAIRDVAVSEVARVVQKWVAMIEPFADFNRDPLRYASTKTKGFFSLGVGDLRRFGLEPVCVFTDMPQKITRGAGLVVARKTSDA